MDIKLLINYYFFMFVIKFNLYFFSTLFFLNILKLLILEKNYFFKFLKRFIQCIIYYGFKITQAI